jgi:hypothetical protein
MCGSTVSLGTERLEINELASFGNLQEPQQLLQRFYHSEMTDAELFGACKETGAARLTSSRATIIKPILAEEIRENPYCSGNLEGLGVFAPIRMIVGIRKNQRYPHQ